MTLGESGVIHLIPLLLLLGGIITGVVLVQKEGYQLFKPKASERNIQFSGSCVGTRNNQAVLNCPTVDIKFVSPLETGQVTDKGSQSLMSQVANMSLIKTAYAAGPSGVGLKCGDDQTKLYNGNGDVSFDCEEGYICKVVDFEVDANPFDYKRAICVDGGGR